MSSRSLWRSTCRYCSTLAASAWKALLPPATLTLWSSGRSQTSVGGNLQGGQRCGGLRLSQELLCVQSACSTACVGSPGSHGPRSPLGHPFGDSELATWALGKARKQAGQTRAWPRPRRRIQCAVLLWKLFNADRSFFMIRTNDTASDGSSCVCRFRYSLLLSVHSRWKTSDTGSLASALAQKLAICPK